MTKSIRLMALASSLAALHVSPNALGSCGTAFCAINTNWDSHGAWAQPGLRLDLRYESINQNQPLSGSGKVAVGAIPLDHDEVRTANRNWLATLDNTFNADWGMSVALPMVKRDHLHLENDFAAGTQTPEAWKFNQVGDTRVTGRYRLATVEGRSSGSTTRKCFP